MMEKLNPIYNICISCKENKPIEHFIIIGGNKYHTSRRKKCIDCNSFIQKLMPYPILKQPSREFILAELERLKSIEHVKPNEL